MSNINMLYYDRIDVSEGIDANKTSTSKYLLEGYGELALYDISKKMFCVFKRFE